MKIRILCVGKLKERFWREAVEEYTKRISRYASVEICELEERKTLQEEGEDILKKLSGTVIVFDINGKAVTSPEFARYFEQKMIEGKSEFSLVIGSSEGLAKEVKDSADIRVSFGLVTYPHQLMRVIVCEQVYRAIAINNRLTYHK